MSRVVPILLSGLLLACASTGPATHGPHALVDADYPGELRPPSTLKDDFMWRQHIRAEWPSGSRAFSAVLQKRGDTLTLVGLNGLGQVGFVITQTGTEVTIDAQGGTALPLPARFILLDVQRVYFPWCPPGTERAELAGEEVVETWEHGALVSRSFRRLDGVPAGTITVQFIPGEDPAEPRRTATVDNGWFDYRLQIETFERRPLTPTAP
jgi:hypothetical protein